MNKSLNQIASEIHQANVNKGFWESENIINKLAAYNFPEEEIQAVQKAFKAQRLMLIVSELSEALEADRKDLQDNHLPEHKGLDVEIVDGMIRKFDFCGGYKIDIDRIMAEKLEYNKNRPYLHGKKF